jgi:hypothetical protein
LALDLGLDIERSVARAYPPRVARNHVFADLLVALGPPRPRVVLVVGCQPGAADRAVALARCREREDRDDRGDGRYVQIRVPKASCTRRMIPPRLGRLEIRRYLRYPDVD